jgi:mannose-6-phosphate isomerase-like protein (cupin superfamily)
MTESIWFTDALMKIHISPEDTRGEYALIEALAPSGHMPPPHIHEHEGEGFFVLEGEITLYTTAGEQVLVPGQGAHVPAGEPHTFRVTSAGPARTLCVSAPAGFAQFVRAAGRPAERETLPVLDGPPDVDLLIREAANHGITMVGPPGTVPTDLSARAQPCAAR